MAENLVDMKYTKAEAKAEASEYTKPQGPEYPWGLQIRLEDEELKKLGITSMPAVGQEMSLDVVVRVTSVSESQYADGRADRCLSLQIVQMGMEDDAEEEGAKAPAPAPAAKQPTKGGVMGRS